MQEDIDAVVQEERVYLFGVLQHANVRRVQHDNVQVGLATDTRINGCRGRDGRDVGLVSVRVCRVCCGVRAIAVIGRVGRGLFHWLFCIVLPHWGIDLAQIN